MKLIDSLIHRLTLFMTMLTLGFIGLVHPATLESIIGIDFTKGMEEI